MLEGLPSLFEYIVAMVTRHRRCDSLAVVIYHLLGDVANATQLALTHYLPLTLTEEFLQNSSLGTPYQKWAKFTNEDFENVDQCLQRLVLPAWKLYEDAALQDDDDRSRLERRTFKHTYQWFDVVNRSYACCVIDWVQPVLTLSAVNIDGWLNAEPEKRVMNYFDEPPSKPEPLPAVTKSTWSISDRATIGELQAVALTRLNEMRETTQRFASWLTANCTLEQLLAPHRGTLSDDARYWHRPTIYR